MKKILTEETIGQRIKAQRLRLGWTQEYLAEVVCLPKTTISTYENDKTDIKSSALTDIARALQTTPNYLLGFGVDPVIEEIGNLMESIKSDEARSIIMAQIKAVASLSSQFIALHLQD